MFGFDRITFDRNIMAGQACIRGMRVPVSLVLNLVANGKTITEIIADYPYLEQDDIRQSLQYAAWLTQERGNVAREVLEIRLAEVLSQCDKDLEMGAIISVRDEAFRVRSLPI
jgi:uncharacterized protein (DUF433 family)